MESACQARDQTLCKGPPSLTVRGILPISGAEVPSGMQWSVLHQKYQVHSVCPSVMLGITMAML